MNQYNLNKLEYNKILKILSGFCHTYIGKEIAQNLTPLNDKNKVIRELEDTAEALSLLDRNGTPPISEIENIETYIKLLESHNTLSSKALLDICNILNIANELKVYFSSFVAEESYPNLTIYFSELYSNNSILDKIQSSIIASDTIADNASSALSSIRRHQRQAEQDIKNKLNAILHSSYSKYI